ncbi:MAG: SAM-dependent methyltransferase [Streptosporangiaceae bacterium]
MDGDDWMSPEWDRATLPVASAITPSPARLYDYYLGGKDNFTADREAAEKIRAAFPALSDAAWANRGFHGRAATWMARHGIRQFIDIGAGLPTNDNTHQVVQRIDPCARVIYADNDRQAVCHARALLVGGPVVTAIDADIRDPAALLANRELRELVDFTQPAGVLITAVMHFVADTDHPWNLVTQLMDAFPPGSYLALSHVTADGISPAAVRAGTEVYDHATEQIYPRTRTDVERFFDGLTLLPPHKDSPPAVTYAGEWGCEDPVLADSDGSRALYAGVARSPGRQEHAA